MSRPRRWTRSLLICIIASHGCQQPDPVDQALASVPVEASFELLARDTCSDAITFEQLLDAVGTHRILTIVDGDQKAERHDRFIEATSDFGAVIREIEIERRTQYFSVQEDQRLLLHAVHTERDHAVALFDPPLEVIGGSLTEGQTQISSASMRVVDSRRLTRELDSGTCSREIRHAGCVKIRTPLGDMTVAQLDVLFRAELKRATAEKKSTLYVCPRRGLMAEQWNERILILKTIPRRNGQTLVTVDVRNQNPSSDE